jgi:hypothetical protein
MLTKNTDKLRREVATHVAADTIAQGIYWDQENQRGCFIGCLARSDNPAANEVEYGLPVVLQRIAESIFEKLPADEAKGFFAALPDAVGCDGKNLSRVAWHFLSAELRSLPPVPAGIQAVIDPVIAGMDLLSAGQDWPAAEAAARAAGAAAWAARADAEAAARAAAEAAAWAARAAAEAAAWAARAAAEAAAWAAEAAAWAAAEAAAWAAEAAAWAAGAAAWAAGAAVWARQRDLLLRLIAEAPVELGK